MLQRQIWRRIEKIFRVANTAGRETSRKMLAREREAFDELTAHGGRFNATLATAFDVEKAVTAGKREIAFFGAQHLHGEHFTTRGGEPERKLGAGIVEEVGQNQDERRGQHPLPQWSQRRFGRPLAGASDTFELEQTAIAMTGAGIGGNQRRTAGGERDETKTIALPQCEFDRARSDRFRGIELAPCGLRRIALRHRCARVDDDPDRQRAVALGLAHEIAIRAREQFPVDASRFVAGFVRAILNEFEAGSSAATRVLSESVATRAITRTQAQLLETRADVRRNERDASHRRS